MATFSKSTLNQNSFTDYYCAERACPNKHKKDQLGDHYCKKCLKCYCEQCNIKHKKKFPKHKPYRRDELSKWPTPKALQDYLQTRDLRKDLKIVNDSQSQYAEVSVQGGPDQVFTVQEKSEYNHGSPPNNSIWNLITLKAICVLSDDQIIVAHDDGVKLLDQQYQVVGHCNLGSLNWDMCLITPSEVAVAMNNLMAQEVQFVSVEEGRLVMGKKLQFQHECIGIAYNLQDLYLTSGTALYKYSMSGELLNKMYEDEDTSGYRTGQLAVHKCASSPSGDKIFVINFSHHKVLTLARDGTLLHTFTDPDLKYPCGIHVTALGQVLLVCGEGSHTIIQLDGEGKKKLATIATKSDGLNYPQSVFYNIRTASIIVGQFKQILVFKVK